MLKRNIPKTIKLNPYSVFVISKNICILLRHYDNHTESLALIRDPIYQANESFNFDL